MKLQVSDAERGVAPYELDTVKISDRLDDLAGEIALADIAVGGLSDEHDLGDDPAISPLRQLLLRVSRELRNVAKEIHREPADAQEAAEGGAS
jgi:hypothetical protein